MQTIHSAPTRPALTLPTHPSPPVVIIPARPISPLMLSDRLITLAQEADRAGHAATASTLIDLAFSVLDGITLQ